MLAALLVLAPALGFDLGFLPARGTDATFVASRGGLACRVDSSGFGFSAGDEGVRFEAPSRASRCTPIGVLPGVVHDLRGADPSGFRVDLAHHERIRLEWDEPAIVLEVRVDRTGFEYDVIAASHEALARFELRVSGAIEFATDGALIVPSSLGRLTQRPLESFALDDAGSRRAIASRVERRAIDRIGFAVDAAADGPIVIDPGIQFSTYLGSTLFDEANDVVVDATGATFVCGSAGAGDFPIVPGSYDVVFGGTFSDAWVAKIAPNGALVWSTFLGGSGSDAANSLALASNGRVHVGGRTQSTDFPVSTGAFDGSANGGIDGFVVALAPDGKSLVQATLLGGFADDEVRAIALGAGDSIFVSGYTGSLDFPATVGAFDSSFNGGGPLLTDAFLARLAPDVKSMVFATFYGGSEIDSAAGLALANGEPVIVGRTESSDLPMLVSSHDATYGGGLGDGFVARFDPTGAILRNASFVGGNDRDALESVATHVDGTTFTTGFARSQDVPIPTGPDLMHGGLEDALVFVFADSGAAIWGAYVGGAADDRALAVSLDTLGASYLTGRTASSDFPAQSFAFDPTPNGGMDAFFTKLRPNGIGYQETGYVGGSGFDEGRAIAVAPGGVGRIVGRTTSTNFPSVSAAQPALKGSSDAFVISLPTAICSNPPSTAIYGTGKAGSTGIPAFAASGLPAIPSTSMLLQITNAKPGAVPLLFLGFSAIALPFDKGTLLTNPVVFLTLPPINALGRLDLPTAFGEDPGLCSVSLYLQVMYVDPAAIGPYHTAQTNGLVLTFGS